MTEFHSPENAHRAAAATAASAAGSANLASAGRGGRRADLHIVRHIVRGADRNRRRQDWRRAVDPIQIKHEYFNQAKIDPAFASLMQVIRERSDAAIPDAAQQNHEHADPNLKFLGRSIILAWYLGAWYEPKTLSQFIIRRRLGRFQSSFKVISPAAYTQGWTWRVAQAHPMGYSELRFGYWSERAAVARRFHQDIGSCDHVRRKNAGSRCGDRRLRHCRML